MTPMFLFILSETGVPRMSDRILEFCGVLDDSFQRPIDHITDLMRFKGFLHLDFK